MGMPSWAPCAPAIPRKERCRTEDVILHTPKSIRGIPAILLLSMLAGCAVNPPAQSPEEIHPVASVLPAGQSPAGQASPASPAVHPAHKKPSQKTADFCAAWEGQTQAWLRNLIDTDRKLAANCLQGKSACWRHLAHTIVRQDMGMQAAPANCPETVHLQHLSTAFLRSAEAVALNCEVRGAPACLQGTQVEKAMDARKKLEAAIGEQP